MPILTRLARTIKFSESCQNEPFKRRIASVVRIFIIFSSIISYFDSEGCSIPYTVTMGNTLNSRCCVNLYAIWNGCFMQLTVCAL